MYAFDVHCNAFFPMFLLLYVLQLVLCPVLLMHTFVATVLSAGGQAWLAGGLCGWVPGLPGLPPEGELRACRAAAAAAQAVPTCCWHSVLPSAAWLGC